MTIPIARYQQRRQRLQSSLPNDGIFVIHSGSLCTRNNDCDYEYRPHSSFLYLTGYKEPDAYLVITKTESILFNLPKDPQKELWDGFRHGVQGALETFGFDRAFPLTDLDEELLTLMDGKETVYCLFSDDALQEKLLTHQKDLVRRQRQGAQAPIQLSDITSTIAEMRLIKDEDEIRVMEQAAQISVQAHIKAMQTVQPNSYEYELEAELNYTFMKSGARTPAYSNIVASGANACILHYIENNCQIHDGDLILIDAGCELDGYASDITRTFPANGKFTEPQAALYDLVLAAQKASIDVVKVGAKYTDFHDATVRVLTKGLLQLGLLQGELETLIADGAYRDFYMHNTGHWLGLDVHDIGAYKINGESRELQAGMVVTVEPGLYVAKDNMNVDEKWRGIGIRIEDDVLVTPEGPYVLTHGLVRERQDVEALISDC